MRRDLWLYITDNSNNVLHRTNKTQLDTQCSCEICVLSHNVWNLCIKSRCLFCFADCCCVLVDTLLIN